MQEVNCLRDTMHILAQGYYIKDGKKVPLQLSRDEREKARVFLPPEVHALESYKPDQRIFTIGRCGYSCENIDTFTKARNNYRDFRYLFTDRDKEILVLNFANPIHPGGGVRQGAKAQEEDLCRTSSLLCSLESKEAAPYYQYNRKLHTYMGSDAVMITPKVEIIKDAAGNLLDESVIVAVMTCAAPILRHGLEGLSEQQYKALFYNRITGMLRVAAVCGYRYLVLGAFGCGAFGNDAEVVSDLFYKALKNFNLGGMRDADWFTRIDFAVLSKSPDLYNYKAFYRNFGGRNFYREEILKQYAEVNAKKEEQRKYLDKIKGSLVGGACGDALGFAVEFLLEEEIRKRYGKQGITAYQLTDGVAQISDDTQMTLFTANAILYGETRLAMRGIGGDPKLYAPNGYLDWYATQTMSFEEEQAKNYRAHRSISWLLDVPQLYARRAPGNTCLSALDDLLLNGFREDYIRTPVNQSKGCGGLMRIAPLGLHYKSLGIHTLDKLGAELSAITHGHSLGYMPSAVLTHILNRIVYPKDATLSLKEICIEARDTVAEIFREDKHIAELTRLIDLAVALSENDADDSENIRMLGGGWVAEETLAIALYCSLKYADDFSKGIIAAVNHSGDSDSTGAVTGNILGAWLGAHSIDAKWTKDLELYDILCEMAEDLCYGCHISEYGDYYDEAWERKYICMHWKENPSSMPQTLAELLRSGGLDKINRVLRNGGMT